MLPSCISKNVTGNVNSSTLFHEASSKEENRNNSKSKCKNDSTHLDKAYNA